MSYVHTERVPFAWFLAGQVDRRDPVGDLARALPTCLPREALRHAAEPRHVLALMTRAGASAEAMSALGRAASEWRATCVFEFPAPDQIDRAIPVRPFPWSLSDTEIEEMA